RELRLRLDAADAASEWQGWSLPDYPTAAWQQGHVVGVPIAMTLPPDLAAGNYQVTAAWIDPRSGETSESISMGSVQVTRRQATFVYRAPAQELDPAPQVGTHAKLRGYTLSRAGTEVSLQLTWE